MSDIAAPVTEYKPLPEIQQLLDDVIDLRTLVNADDILDRVIEILKNGEPFHPEPRPESGQGGWKETARAMANGSDFYYGIVNEIGEAIGPEAYVCDDGSTTDKPLALKLVELVKKLKANQKPA